MTNLVIFDIDKTLVKKNLHEIIIGYWIRVNENRTLALSLVAFFIKCLPHSFLRRRFEYFVVLFIKESDIKSWTREVIEDDNITNQKIMRRISHYKRNNVEIAFVTAAPEKVVKHLSLQLEIPVHSSKSIFGVIYNDLLARKSKAYDRLVKKGYKIRSVYSDSTLDFHPGAKNFLVSEIQDITIQR